MSDDFYDDYGSPFIDVPYSCGCYLWFRCADHKGTAEFLIIVNVEPPTPD